MYEFKNGNSLWMDATYSVTLLLVWKNVFFSSQICISESMYVLPYAGLILYYHVFVKFLNFGYVYIILRPVIHESSQEKEKNKP